jgi:hypothetical protein
MTKPIDGIDDEQSSEEDQFGEEKEPHAEFCAGIVPMRVALCCGGRNF